MNYFGVSFINNIAKEQKSIHPLDSYCYLICDAVIFEGIKILTSDLVKLNYNNYTSIELPFTLIEFGGSVYSYNKSLADTTVNSDNYAYINNRAFYECNTLMNMRFATVKFADNGELLN